MGASKRASQRVRSGSTGSSFSSFAFSSSSSELKAKLEKELPIEQDLTRWLALFDAPI